MNGSPKGVNACAFTPSGCERTGSDNASDKRQSCRLSLALSLENLGVRTGSVRACVRQIGMTSYILELLNAGRIFVRFS